MDSDPRAPTDTERAYREVLPELDGQALTELLMKHAEDPQLRNALVTLIAELSGQTRTQVFNALADLYALRLILRSATPQG